MKKYLLFIISMLCVSIGTWATPTNFGTNSTWEIDGTGKVLTLTINTEADLTWTLPEGLSLSSVNTVKVVTGTEVTLHGGNNNALNILWGMYGGQPVLDLSNASVEYTTVAISGIDKQAMVMCNDDKLKNVVVPTEYASNPQDLILSNIYYAPTTYKCNRFTVSGSIAKAYLERTGTGDIAALSDVSSSATTLKLLNDKGAIDLTSVLTSGQTLDITSFTETTGTITVASGVTVACPNSAVAARVTGGTTSVPVISCAADGLSAAITALGDIAPMSITITGGTLTSEQMAAFGTMTSLTYLSLQEEEGTNIASLAIPSSLECLVLPKSGNPEGAYDNFKSKISGNTTLYYVYAPFSGTQGADQMVADYVWVNKPGGLSKAFDEQTRLLSAWYMIVESTVALNDDDVNFWGSDPGHARPMQYRYLDLSGANITPAVLANYKVTDYESYRIILPNDWTGDMMAVFAANPDCGNLAAVYSYTGTDHKRLDILEIHDYAYSPNALHDARIVREGTEAVRVISGSHNGTMYSKFGPNLLAAINAANDTPNDGDETNNHIKKVTVAVGDGIYTAADAKVSSATTFTFDNDNLTNLDLSYTNNSYVTIDVSGCAGLTNFQMNEATVAAVNASGINGLATVSLGHTTVGGDVNLASTPLTTQLEVDKATIGGELKVSGSTATSFDFSALTADKVDATNTNSLTSLNINGITLDVSGVDSEPSGSSYVSGKINVTRSEGDYSGLTITKSNGYSEYRIIPLQTTPAEGKRYTLRSFATPSVEITVASPLSSNTAAQLPAGKTVADVQRLHVTTALTSEDITYIKDNLHVLELLDLSSLESITDEVFTALKTNIPTSVAIVLPGSTNTEEGVITRVRELQTAGFECVAYYTAQTPKKLINVFTKSDKVKNLESTNPALIDNTTTITFIRQYVNDNVNSMEHTFPQVQPSLLTGLAYLPAACVDMTWLDISKLGVDFSGLNAATHYLIIPQNTNAATTTISTNTGTKLRHNDFTDETTSSGSDVYYKYSDNIYAVSTYKEQTGPYATVAYFAGKGMNFASYGINEKAALTYIRNVSGYGFDDVVSYMPSYMTADDVIAMFAGRLNNDDITGLNSLPNRSVDLTRATPSSPTWSSYTGSNVYYLALPDGENALINATSPDAFGFSGLTNLKAVGAYAPASTTYTVHSTNTGTENSVYKVTKMCAPSTGRVAGSAKGTTTVVMSGYLTRGDIQANGGTVYSGSTNEAGLESSNACTITNADLSKAVFLNNEDMVLPSLIGDGTDGASWGNSLTSIQLPTDSRQTRVPAKALYGFHLLENLCIPYNIQEIGANAFMGCHQLKHITTTDGSGNPIDNGNLTYTLGSNLTKIETGAFVAYKWITDVYVLATTAPICERDAFDIGTYVSNNSYAGVTAHPFCRERYVTNSDQGTMAVLHFPSTISATEAANYTDLTREYSLIDETGVLDGQGIPVAWPNQAEYLRSYDQAVTGVTWDAWDKTRDGQNGIEYGTYNTATPGLGTSPAYNATKYIGWHQFCLCASWASHIVEPITETVKYDELNWYTLCLPYNMTKAQVLKYFGIPASVTSGENIVYNQLEDGIDITEDIMPDIRTMVGVTRTKEKGDVKNKILIVLSSNLSASANDINVGLQGATYDVERALGKNSSGETLDNTDDNKIYLRGGYPYFIKAYLPHTLVTGMQEGGLSLGALTMMRAMKGADAATIRANEGNKKDVAVIIDKEGNTSGTESVLAPQLVKVQAKYINGETEYFADKDDTEDSEGTGEDDDDFIYSFQGQYWSQYLPLGCYYLGSGNKFFRAKAKLNGNSDKWSKWEWKPYVSIITPKYKEEDQLPMKNGSVYNRSYSEVFLAGDDAFQDTSWSRTTYELLFDDDIIDVDNDETTAVGTLNGEIILSSGGKVYNMNGQLVGASLDGLPKGLYIVNGKKVVVK